MTRRVAPFLDLLAQKPNADALADVATSGSYGDLQDKPELGSAAAAETTDFATAAEGALADTALQPTTGVVRLPTFAYASIASGLTDVQRVFVEDRRAHFARVDSEPAHDVAFENEGWWALDELTVTPFMAGAAGDGVTDDTNAVKAIVGFAYLLGATIYWPDANFLTTESIPNFHDVKNTGPGRILRGDDVWYITPSVTAQINRLYVDGATGNDASDGLSADCALATGQAAADHLARKVPLSNGTYEIKIAAGQYARIRLPDEGLASRNPIRIIGAPVAVAAGFDIGFLASDLVGTFAPSETVTCSGGAVLTVLSVMGRLVIARIESGVPAIGETVAGGTSGATALLDYVSPRPRTLIKEGATQTAFGLRLAEGTKVWLEDIQFEDFNGSISSSGIYAADRCYVGGRNVWIEDCYIGVAGLGTSVLDFDGGIFNDFGYLNSVTLGGYGVRAHFHTPYVFGSQNAGTRAGGPLLINGYIAAFGQEHTNGHLDWCLIEDCATAIRLNINSRLNTDGSRVRRCGTVFWATNGTSITPGANFELGTGADENYRAYWSGGGSASGDLFSEFSVAYAASDRCIMRRGGNPLQTIATTAPNTIYSLTALANIFRDLYVSNMPAKAVRFEVYARLNGANSNKRFHLRLGGTPLASLTFSASDTGDCRVTAGITFAGPGQQMAYIEGIRHQGGIRNGIGPGSNAMTSNTAVSITASVDNTSDSIEILGYAFHASGA